MILIVSILLLLVSFSIPRIFAVENNIYKAENPAAICQDVISGKIQIGVHSFYNDNDTILENRKNGCSNSTYFTNNLADKTEGEDYPTWTYFDRSSSTYNHYIEGIDVTNADKYRYLYIQNHFQEYNASTGKIIQSKTLKAGESIFVDIDISDKNINMRDYDDLRISFHYGQNESNDVMIIQKNS